jgi:hypothetical protein
MRQLRNGMFFAQNLSDEQVLQKIKMELGPGDWRIEWERTGASVKWVAQKDTIQQGPLR